MFNESPLQLAATAGQFDHVRQLLESGAEVNARDSVMNSALHDALLGGAYNDDVVELLLAYGADAGARGQWSRTPSDIAVEQGRMDIAESLRAAAADDRREVPIPHDAESYPRRAMKTYVEQFIESRETGEHTARMSQQDLWNHLIDWTTEANVDEVIDRMPASENFEHLNIHDPLVEYLNDDRRVMIGNPHRPAGLAILRSRLITSPPLFHRFIRDEGLIAEELVMHESFFDSSKLKWCHEPWYNLKHADEVSVLIGDGSYRLHLGIPDSAFSISVPEPLQQFAKQYPGHLFSLLSDEGIPVVASAITTAAMSWEDVVHPLTFIDTACRPPADLPMDIPLEIDQLVRENSPALSIAVQNYPDSIPELFDLFDFCSHFAAMVMLQGEHVWSKLVNVFQKVGPARPFSQATFSTD